MFRWSEDTKTRAIDLSCVEYLTIEDVAFRLGASLSCVKKFYAANHAEIEASRKSIHISDKSHCAVLDLWDDGVGQADIAASLCLPCDVVRRIILLSEIDNEPEPSGCDDELAALREAFPDRLYPEDARALTEYGKGWRRPVFLLAADVVEPFSQPGRMTA